MIKLFTILASFILISLVSCSEKPIIVADLVVDQSVKFKKGTYYLLSHEGLDEPQLVVSGENITIDFNEAEIIGDTNYYNPDTYTGLGIHILNGKNITIKNLSIRGFKIGILAENTPGLKIENCDLSYNYRPRLRSIREREDLSDWLSYHDNENDEWFNYGAGIYLKNCDHAVIRENFITENQNALLMTQCDSGRITDNIFIFNSGLGIGMYRSSHNRILHNCLDFNVRGYSHGIYQRGQDSAGILAYEQSSNNEFSYNSATHSGDGFFLWAGQHTMDTGQGGCNDNIIAHNDFSYAPTNGIEVTFSSNLIFHNKVVGCRYGIWAGYSHHTQIIENEFEENEYGVAFEHGNNNIIVGNSFSGDSIGIKLWERDRQPQDWGFAEKRDVSSRDYTLGNNKFEQVIIPFDIQNTSGLDTVDVAAPKLPVIKKLYSGLEAADLITLVGRDKIMVNEWGPYNFKYPFIHLAAIDSSMYRFTIWGEGTNWRIVRSLGFTSLDKQEGVFPDTIAGVRDPDQEVIFIELQYSGGDYYDQWGILRTTEKDQVFSYSRYEKDIDWTIKWVTWDDMSHPVEHYDTFRKILDTKNRYEEQAPRVAYTWWRQPFEGVDPERFGTLATSSDFFTPDKYLIELSSDDGVRFFIDDLLIIDNWDIHVPETDTVHVHLDGRHNFRIEHFEAGGLSTLDFKIRPLGN